MFSALADPVRRDLLAAVAERPRRVVDLAAGRGISRPAVSRHLRRLAEAGLVTAEQQGRERHYRVRPEPLVEMRAYLATLPHPRSRPTLLAADLEALDTEVHRTSRERRRARRPASSTEEIA